jgi:hypothetical protein
MKRVLIEFDKLPWESPRPGVRYKAFVSGTQQLRLLEFSDGFEEKEWCTKGHAFYVLDGLLLLRMKNGVVRMKAGQIPRRGRSKQSQGDHGARRTGLAPPVRGPRCTKRAVVSTGRQYAGVEVASHPMCASGFKLGKTWLEFLPQNFSTAEMPTPGTWTTVGTQIKGDPLPIANWTD